jgi:hypothetical protein
MVVGDLPVELKQIFETIKIAPFLCIPTDKLEEAKENQPLHYLNKFLLALDRN